MPFGMESENHDWISASSILDTKKRNISKVQNDTKRAKCNEKNITWGKRENGTKKCKRRFKYYKKKASETDRKRIIMIDKNLKKKAKWGNNTRK